MQKIWLRGPGVSLATHAAPVRTDLGLKFKVQSLGSLLFRHSGPLPERRVTQGHGGGGGG